MLLYWTRTHIILEDDGSRILWNFATNAFTSGDEINQDSFDEAVFCGVVDCIVGTLPIGVDTYIFFVSESTPVSQLRGIEQNTKYNILRVDKVIAVKAGVDLNSLKGQFQTSTAKIKQNTEKIFKFIQNKITNTKSTLLEDTLRLFNEARDFYFCKERDITISSQKYFSEKSNKSEESFFWNKYMVEELSKMENSKKWVCPITQGFVSKTKLEIVDQIDAVLDITIISRRSIHRAGARYLRRGIDSESYVANFVETEVVLNIFDHDLSFVQIRGSVPLFWSQRGFRYRPPLIIDRPVEEAKPVFDKHMNNLMEHYGTPLVVVSLVDQKGRELELAQKYIELSTKLDNEDLSFFSFDLHEHCKGMNFNKIQLLIQKMEAVLKTIGFCWIDKTGEVVQTQKGIVRTNCVDCLDRTNVVQGAISIQVVLKQAQRLGIFGPLCDPPEILTSTIQTLWADNGDAISTQYAGTRALKGDVTRTGERKLTGIMKDGYNSASRYYLTHTKDAAKQNAINLVTRQVEESRKEDSDSDEEENLKHLVSETIQFLIPSNVVVIGGWGLVNAAGSSEEIDTIIILTREKLYIAIYDAEGEKMTEVNIVALADVKSIEIGPLESRVGIKLDSEEGTYLWRTSSIRLFNNVAIPLKSNDEAVEYVNSIAEQIAVAKNLATETSIEVATVRRLTPSQSIGQRFTAANQLFNKIKGTGKRLTGRTETPSDSPPEDANDPQNLVNKLAKSFVKEREEPFKHLEELISGSKCSISLL